MVLEPGSFCEDGIDGGIGFLFGMGDERGVFLGEEAGVWKIFLGAGVLRGMEGVDAGDWA